MSRIAKIKQRQNGPVISDDILGIHIQQNKDIQYLIKEVERYREALTRISKGETLMAREIAKDALMEGIE